MAISAIGLDVDGTLYPNIHMRRRSLPRVLRRLRFFAAYSRVREALRALGPVSDFYAEQAPGESRHCTRRGPGAHYAASLRRPGLCNSRCEAISRNSRVPPRHGRPGTAHWPSNRLPVRNKTGAIGPSPRVAMPDLRGGDGGLEAPSAPLRNACGLSEGPGGGGAVYRKQLPFRYPRREAGGHDGCSSGAASSPRLNRRREFHVVPRLGSLDPLEPVRIANLPFLCVQISLSRV